MAETVSFQKEYTYQAGDMDSKDAARIIAMENAKRLLFGEIEAYLESKALIKNLQLTKNQATALISVIVKTDVIEQKWDNNAFYVKAGVSVNSDEIVKSIAVLSRDKRNTGEIEEVRKKASGFLKKIEKLKERQEADSADGKTAPIISGYNEAVKILSAIGWFENGCVLVNSGNPQKAVEAFTKAIKLSPNNEKFYVFRGNAYGEAGSNNQAVKDIAKAIKLNPKYAKAYVSRGNAYLRSGSYQQAVKDYSVAVKLSPKHEEAYCYRGVAYGALGKEQQALEDFSHAIKINPEYEKAYFYRGLAYAESANYHKALEDFNKAVELNPGDSEAYFNRGRVYGLLGDTYKAVEDIRKAARLGDKAAQNFLKMQKIEW
ncbi:MAG: tetratricopeptide repeat protein [Nitrospirae bacterium]|nr:tetratricopeptide repeat protein [Nitrospirota bacterium]MBI3378289.1 tetratricopeptide repeat protein [Nitrospirota bacterium]